MNESIKQILMWRDGISAEDADELIEEARDAVIEGRHPEEVCPEFFGLDFELAYIWELL